ncbi:restriction endonuclease subunit S [Idiomarina aminovorans]|uniref:restriction endonuclease subunit S n=1 Tax=Idiomarina aminovorans TaxID=2914829 RepID=UPI002005D444|nr:restriction endonuclease subunit S [Idiomarina sp. ATCH4]MCK7460030.1 restriction endonuclease subunit S [Idiomarina sp. ATCH4]
MVPKGWSIKPVGDLFNVQLGKMLNKTAKEKTPQFPYLGNSNVQWGRFELSDLKAMHFTERETVKFSLEPNDIIMCEGGEVGRCAIWHDVGRVIFYQKALHRLRTKGEVIPEFFKTYMESISGTKLLDDYTTRTSIAHLTREKLLLLPVRLPTLKEQKKIAQILSTWDKAITTTEQLLAKSQQQKKALMQQLLTGKKRLLDENGVRFSGEWGKSKLENLCAIKTGKKDVNEGNKSGMYPFFTCANEPTWSDSYSYDCEALLIAGNGMLGKTHYYNGKFEAYQRTYILSNFNHQVDVSYLHQFILYWLARDIDREKQHGAMPYIKLGLLRNFKVFIPQIEEQKKISNFLVTAEKEVNTYQKNLERLKLMKKALMQQLLTGKRRVKVDEEAA